MAHGVYAQVQQHTDQSTTASTYRLTEHARSNHVWERTRFSCRRKALDQQLTTTLGGLTAAVVSRLEFVTRLT